MDGLSDSWSNLRFTLFDNSGTTVVTDPNQATFGVVLVAIIVGGTITGFCLTALICMGLKGCSPEDDPEDEEKREKHRLRELVEKRETMLLHKMDTRLRKDEETKMGTRDLE